MVLLSCRYPFYWCNHFLQVIFSMLGASCYNFQIKRKCYLHLQSTEGKWLIVCVKRFLSEFSFYFSYFSYKGTNFRHIFLAHTVLLQCVQGYWSNAPTATFLIEFLSAGPKTLTGKRRMNTIAIAKHSALHHGMKRDLIPPLPLTLGPPSNFGLQGSPFPASQYYI